MPERFVPGPSRIIKCFRCKTRVSMNEVAKGCFTGRCEKCNLEIRGAIGEYTSLDSDIVDGHMSMISYPVDLSPDKIGRFNDNKPGRRWPKKRRPKKKQPKK